MYIHIFFLIGGFNLFLKRYVHKCKEVTFQASFSPETSKNLSNHPRQFHSWLDSSADTGAIFSRHKIVLA